MSSLKRSIFWVSLYLGAVFLLAQFDYADSPIIDFAKYFYFMVMVVVPVTIFFPYTTKVNALVPVLVWGSVYIVMLQTLDREVSAPNSTFSIILLEFILVIVGVWLAYQLAYGISHAESIMDAMALSIFPNRGLNIQAANKQIRIEITRSRRYHRVVSFIVLQINPSDHIEAEKMVFNVQHDMLSRFSFARIGQIVDENIRQTDTMFRDQLNRFVIVCPETDHQNSQILADRICDAIKIRAGLRVIWSTVSFPDDALNFDDLMDVARERLVLRSKADASQQAPLEVRGNV